MDIGSLKVQVCEGNTYKPLENAKVTVIQSKENSNRRLNENLSTDSSGIVENIELETPPLEYSIKPSEKLPYSVCDIVVEMPGYKKLIINGCQMYSGVTTVQRCNLHPLSERDSNEEIINILPNVLNGNYELKIPETSYPKGKPIFQLISLHKTNPKRVIPKPITVHYGNMEDLYVPNYAVDYKQYIKCVAASEIYPTWHTEALRANVYAMLSFTLNRVFTEFYRGKGKDYNITSTTAMDHLYIHKRGTFANIDEIVDEIFAEFIQKDSYEFPLLAQYCDGKRVLPPPGWMSQWGSQEKAEQGMKAIEILKYYYGGDSTLVKVEKEEKLQESYPGEPLKLGSIGEAVKEVQINLNKISKNYPAINKISEDGIYNENTEKAVKTFQGIVSFKKTGIVDYKTWYKISDVYVGITGETRTYNKVVEKIFIPPIFNPYDYDIPTTTFWDKED